MLSREGRREEYRGAALDPPPPPSSSWKEAENGFRGVPASLDPEIFGAVPGQRGAGSCSNILTLLCWKSDAVIKLYYLYSTLEFGVPHKN